MTYKKTFFACLVIAVLLSVLIPYSGKSREAQAGAPPRIAITIDDGYNFDHRIVDFLTSQGISASAFLVGAWAQKNASLVKELDGLGWDICNHTQNHPWLTKVPDATVQAEISTCQSVITSITGESLPFFRPPGGLMDDRVKGIISSMGYIPVMWNFDSQDAVQTKLSIQDRINYIANSAQDGNVILFHFGGKGSLELITGIVRGLQQRGFSFVTLKELYGWKDVIRGGESGPGLGELSTRFYFPEGSTRPGFEEWILATNPGDKAADLSLHFLSQQGKSDKQFRIDPGERISISVNEAVPWRDDVYTVVDASVPIGVERMLYFNRGHGFSGGSLGAGQREGSRRYYFAEGSTRPGFQEWLVVLNPSPSERTAVKVEIFGEGQTPQTATLTVGPLERITKQVNEMISEKGDVSMRITSELPIVAERSQYFTYDGSIPGAHTGSGSSAPHNEWYFAEGTTRNLFESYLTLFNPCRYPTLVKAMLPVAGGEMRQEVLELGALQRKTLHLNEYLPKDADYSVHLQSLLPIVAERSTYFQTQNVNGGYCSSGINSPRQYSLLCEGSTAPGSSEWLALFNPLGGEQEVSVRYLPGGQDPIERKYLLPQQGRVTLDVGAEAGQNNQVSIEVMAPRGVVAERSIYFSRSSGE
ncbi:MAG: hypothetical protein A2Y75_01760 [Candidatus Solincola sediminis]|uniref:NodB homology domain-containing protein n=1 Tax=Candidatus Solincola sediminis TaxID=1797199 RepID=A0A1F2WQT2_9ACTN|nr:MAG: hypothetical protein A2Y75_01760 [Candidatus Solincola sediminis]